MTRWCNQSVKSKGGVGMHRMTSLSTPRNLLSNTDSHGTGSCLIESNTDQIHKLQPAHATTALNGYLAPPSPSSPSLCPGAHRVVPMLGAPSRNPVPLSTATKRSKRHKQSPTPSERTNES